MKYLPLLLLFLSFNAFANPEIGRQIHFVLDKNDANNEFKPSSGSNCTGGVVPKGNGTAWGEITCISCFDHLPWREVPIIYADTEVNINSSETANVQCELFDFSNNAGNNQGFNVTQYNATAWVSRYKAKRNTLECPGYKVTMHTLCLGGLQQ